MKLHDARKARPEPRTVLQIAMCCNDPDDGTFAGRISAIQVGEALELAYRHWAILSYRGCPKLRIADSHLILSGKGWPIASERSWVGNWCWNAYGMHLPVVADFLTWLREKDTFTCEGGYATVCKLWDGKQPITADALKAAIA